MVFVAVGEHQREDVSALFDQIADVWKNEIDARQMLFRGERYAAIHDDPLPPLIDTEAVDREIHPDLADAAQACEYELVARHGLARPEEREPLAVRGEGKHVAGRDLRDAAVGSLK